MDAQSHRNEILVEDRKKRNPFVVTINQDWMITSSNSGAERGLNCSPGSEFLSLVAEVDRQFTEKKLNRAIYYGDKLQFQIRFEAIERLFDLKAIPVTTRDGACEIILLMEDLEEFAMHETAIHWRDKKNFVQRMEEYLHQDSPFTFIQCKVDYLKYIGEVWGKEVEEKILYQTVNRISEFLVDTDYLLCKLSQETFALIVHDKNPEELGAWMSRLMTYLNQPIKAFSTEINLTVKAGVVLDPNKQAHAFTVLDYAQSALKKVEQIDGLYHLFGRKEQEEHARELKLESELIQAVREQQFTIHYQPIVNTFSKRVKGVEALLRWDHPELGIIPPDRFIPYLEKTGFIVQVGYDTLKKVCQQLKQLNEQGFRDINVHYNLSVQQLQCQHFLTQLKRITQSEGIDPSHLVIELTESSLIEDRSYFLNLIEQIRAYGCQISIDDFGTGFSALSYLSRLHIDSIKVDKSFIHQLAEGEKEKAIVRSIISLTKHLNLNVVAEGVEEEEQLAFLMKHRCFDMQGFYFSKPLEAQEMERFLERYNDHYFKE